MRFRYFLLISALTGVLVGSLYGVQPRALMLSGPAGTGGCTAATNFLARTSGESSPTQAALTTMICGLVADGIITGNLSGATGCGSRMDAIYFMAMDNSADSLLNLCGTSFSLVVNGSPTFAANAGWSGVDSANADFLDTQYVPSTSGGVFAQSAAHLSAYILTDNNTTSEDLYIMGAHASGPNPYSAIIPRGTTDIFEVAINDAFDGATAANSLYKGYYVANRSGASAMQFYKNGASIGTATNSSVGLPPFSVYLLAINLGGSPNGELGEQIAVATIGGTVTSTQVSSSGGTSGTGLAPRFCAALHAVNPTAVPSC